MEWKWSVNGVEVECNRSGSEVQSEWVWSVNGVLVECKQSGSGM